MTNVFGIFDPQALVVLVVALVGLVPVALYREKISRWFLYAYGFLLVAAISTNLEYVFLGDLLNFTEHFLGNMGAGIAFAVAAYMYRQNEIETDAETAADPEA